MKRTFIAALLSLIIMPVYADEIPFVIKTLEYIEPSGNNPSTNFPGHHPVVVKSETKVAKISDKKVTDTIREVKESVCAAVGEGDVKVYFSIDASGKLLGVGGSLESGLEVSFKCRAG